MTSFFDLGKGKRVECKRACDLDTDKPDTLDEINDGQQLAYCHCGTCRHFRWVLIPAPKTKKRHRPKPKAGTRIKRKQPAEA